MVTFQDTYPFHEANVQGEWVGETAGGYANYMETYVNNPQFVCAINDDSNIEDGTPSCVIQLLQKGARTKKGQGVENPYLTIGTESYCFDNQTHFKPSLFQDLITTVSVKVMNYHLTCLQPK